MNKRAGDEEDVHIRTGPAFAETMWGAGPVLMRTFF
jgi:hypothetical protein